MEECAMPAMFDPATLAALRDTKEVRIRAARHKGSGVVIWIVAKVAMGGKKKT